MSTLRIATWNVNSIRTRIDRLTAWLTAKSPDVLCLQETKVVDEAFPAAPIEALGYRIAHYGQKTYNGVAILSKLEIDDVVRGFGDGEDEGHSRLISATVGGVRVVSAYFPNGATLDSDKYQFKRSWIRRLESTLARRHSKDEPIALCGDFNIAPDERDVKNPDVWRGSVLFADEIREDLKRLRDFGFVDTFRLHAQEGGHFSWWDYQQLAFPRDDGLRIDHIDVTPSLAQRCVGCVIDRDQRRPKGGPEGTKPSDHAPVVAEFGA
jgi:exodeoxyribonuclease III